MDIQAFRDVQRQVWSQGDYPQIGRLLEPAAHLLVDAAEVTSGHRVLDVATGAGGVAVAAAQAGGEVVGVDITDAWFDEARHRAAGAGVGFDLIIGDVEQLPIEDASFDRVLSNFGAIFAPRHHLAASELVRVYRPGGTIALTAWTPGGTNDATFSSMLARLPLPPAFAMPFIRWGDPLHVREMFAGHDLTLTLQQHGFPVEFDSAEAFESFVFDTSGGVRRARDTLEESGQWEESHAAFRAAVRTSNEAADGTFRTTWDFLLILATRHR
jgi:SAM-dependent methyltransferase